jgi:polysaccharide export outer membrane protein
MGFIKRAVVSIVALGLGALLVANWRSQNDLHRKFEALAATLTGRSADRTEPAAPRPSPAASAEPGRLPLDFITPNVVPAAGVVPRELDSTRMPQSVIEPPDVLAIDVLLRDPRSGQSERLPVQPINGEFLVRPDGTVNLGVWGSASVTGLTPEKAAEVIRGKLAAFTQVNGTSSRIESLAVTVQVKANNSKAYYIITDSGNGENVTRKTLDGTLTILDAIADVPGLVAVADRRTIRVARKGAAGAANQVLPVDWTAIIQRGDTRTNYQLLPDDRVYVTGGR